ncbi:hypothetical protein CKM354_000778500 [Cercospora kikuchii]|uniref:GFO/IDH/MocA-like oxidoreductase domain-containing protein n=1 Tax=Cercospora kikuchii TaxID=84275 RepID=A0A9P3CKW3_9PEZI|nr:uncharacterized protein CKM354_000778500 [Cercospora kikuchii]GIZ44591.1 hypothetical protein CKM354_000778500 [Cercospora kikuchii]
MKKDDIRFQYAIAGGAMMDLGTYPLSCVRQVMRREAVGNVDSAHHRGLSVHADGTPPDPQIDTAMRASFRTATGKRCTIDADLAASTEYLSFLPKGWRLRIPAMGMPKCEAVMEEVPVSDKHDGGTDTEHLVQKVITMWNFMLPVVYHRIDVVEKHRILRHGKEVKSWEKTTFKKAYNWAKDDPRRGKYKDYFTTWRAQLEEFVNRVKGREGSRVWVDGEESVRQMEGIDAIYTKAGLAVRPSSRYASES